MNNDLFKSEAYGTITYINLNSVTGFRYFSRRKNAFGGPDPMLEVFLGGGKMQLQSPEAEALLEILKARCYW